MFVNLSIIWSLLLFLLSMQSSLTKLKPFPDELTTRKSLSKCITTACKIHLNSTSSILVINLPIEEVSASKTSAVTLDMLLYYDLSELYTFSMLINKAIGNRPSHNIFVAKADIYLIHVRKKDEIIRILKHLENSTSWNPGAKFIVTSVTNFKSGNNNIASHLVKILWSFKIINGVILLPRLNSNVLFDIYSWSPFKEGKCGNEFGSVTIIDECSFGKFLTNALWFPNRIPNNLKECEVKVRTIIWPPFVNEPVRKVSNNYNQFIFENGIEINIMNTIAKIANFTVNYTISRKPEDWGYVNINGSTSGMMASLINEEVDIGMSSVGATVTRYQFFDNSITYLQEGITFCVPRSLERPYWKRVSAILPLSVYILCALYVLLIMLISTNLAKFNEREYSGYKNYIKNLFNVLRIITGNPLSVQPKSTKVRFLIMLWVIFSLNLNITYETSLVSVLTSNSHTQELKTVDSLLKSNYKLYLLPPARRFFKDSMQATREFKKKLINCDQMETCLARVAYKKDIATFTPKLYYYYVRNVYVDGNGKSLIYYFRDNVVTYPIQMLMRRNFILKDRINMLLARIIAAGLIPYWVRRTFNDKHLGINRVNFHKHVTMSMVHLRFVFFIYVILMSFAIFVFLVEIFIFNYLNRFKKIINWVN